MLLKQLSDEERRIFLRVAELLYLCDKPLLWNGKRREDGAQGRGSGTLALRRDAAGAEALEALSVRLASATGTLLAGIFGDGMTRTGIEGALVERIGNVALIDEDDPALRAKFATELLRETLKDRPSTAPSVPKAMLFELFLLALAEDAISNVQWRVLEEFKHHYQLEDHLFNDLLERARITQLEARKTIAIILD